jgi:probable HAF family extracellular repeat protein
MQYLPSASDPTPLGYARAINDLGEVVGVVNDGPFIWDSVAGMRNLNDLLDDSGDGWVLTHAYDINDRGQIVGFGTNPDGDVHGFLLNPVPEPSTLIIWSLLGALGIGVGWWRRKRT